MGWYATYTIECDHCYETREEYSEGEFPNDWMEWQDEVYCIDCAENLAICGTCEEFFNHAEEEGYCCYLVEDEHVCNDCVEDAHHTASEVMLEDDPDKWETTFGGEECNECSYMFREQLEGGDKQGFKELAMIA